MQLFHTLNIQNHKHKMVRNASSIETVNVNKRSQSWCIHYSSSKCAHTLGILRQELYHTFTKASYLCKL